MDVDRRSRRSAEPEDSLGNLVFAIVPEKRPFRNPVVEVCSLLLVTSNRRVAFQCGRNLKWTVSRVGEPSTTPTSVPVKSLLLRSAP